MLSISDMVQIFTACVALFVPFVTIKMSNYAEYKRDMRFVLDDLFLRLQANHYHIVLAHIHQSVEIVDMKLNV